MNWRRVLRYGFFYWIVGLAITFTEVRFGVSDSLVRVIFFVAAVIVPLIAFWFYFRRGATPSWQLALQSGIVWIILFTVLDSIFYIGFAGMSWGTYLSWYVAVDHALLLLIGAGMGKYLRRSHGHTEGLA